MKTPGTQVWYTCISFFSVHGREYLPLLFFFFASAGKTSQRRNSITNPPPDVTYDSQTQKLKFGLRKGTRFYCTYVSPVTGERCAAWDQGWTVFATLNRHAESDHAHEELALIANGELTYSEAQIVTSRDKQERIEENLANTRKCPDCGTVFSSNRKDSMTRHKQTNAWYVYFTFLISTSRLCHLYFSSQ